MPKACVHIQYVFVFYFYFPFIEFAYDNTLGICNSINFSLNIRTKRAQRPLSLIINYIYITIKYNIYIFCCFHFMYKLFQNVKNVHMLNCCYMLLCVYFVFVLSC